MAHACPSPLALSPQSTQRLEIRLQASARGLAGALRECEVFLAAQEVASQARLRLALVLEEVVMNVATHGHATPGPHFVDVGLGLSQGELELVVCDDGTAFDPLAASLPVLPESLETARPGGLGLLLMRRFSRAMTYERVGNRNCLRMWLR
jgi:serine/threonine-protein kinase RsbW